MKAKVVPVPLTLAAQYLHQLDEARSEQCGRCGSWRQLVADGVDQLACLACNSVAKITLNKDNQLVASEWRKG